MLTVKYSARKVKKYSCTKYYLSLYYSKVVVFFLKSVDFLNDTFSNRFLYFRQSWTKIIAKAINQWDFLTYLAPTFQKSMLIAGVALESLLNSIRQTSKLTSGRLGSVFLNTFW